jgi:hypothetical protein
MILGRVAQLLAIGDDRALRLPALTPQGPLNLKKPAGGFLFRETLKVLLLPENERA